MVVIALVAVNWALAMAGLAISERAGKHILALEYWWVPDARRATSDDPIFAEHFAILEQPNLSEQLAFVALGAPPIVSLLGFGVAMLLRSLIKRGECSPYVVGFLFCGPVVLFGYLVVVVLAPQTLETYARLLSEPAARLVPRAIARALAEAGLYEGFGFAHLMLVLGLPLVLLASLGGWLNERFLRIALTILPRASVDSPATPSPPPK